MSGIKRRHDFPMQYIEASRLHTWRPEVLEPCTGNPLSPEPFVSHAKGLPAKRNEKGYGDEKVEANAGEYR